MAAPEADGGRRDPTAPTIDLDRRRAMKFLGGATIGAGSAKAIDNLFLGFGVLTGTNLLEQPVGALARAHLRPSRFTLERSGHRLVFDGERVTLGNQNGERVDAFPIADVGPERATAIDAEYGLDGDPLTELATDLAAIDGDAYTFEFGSYPAFFDRISGATARPITVAALRGIGFRRPSPETVRRFTDVDPADPGALVAGLAAGFREHTRYDLRRFGVRSIQQHALFGAVNLDRHFRSSTDYEAIQDGRPSGMLCWDLTDRSIEAFHAVAPPRQAVPVLGAKVIDARHGHVYTGLASAIREPDGLTLPMTFLDYRNATIIDDLSLQGVFGEGIDAYDRRHRASSIAWDR